MCEWEAVKSLKDDNSIIIKQADKGGASVIMSKVGWLVGFVALRPKSTAMVIAGRSVHLTALFPGQA